MTGSICDYFTGETTTAFCGLTNPWEELVRDFGGEGGIRSLRIFIKYSVINRFGVYLPTTI